MVTSPPWLLLLYKVPPDPTANRVYVWRKLKRLGAVLLHDAAWVLPATTKTREQLQWLAAEIGELGGNAYVWEARHTLVGSDEALVQQFRDQVEPAYREILGALAAGDGDPAALARRYQQVHSIDYFDSPLGRQARDALLAARGGPVE